MNHGVNSRVAVIVEMHNTGNPELQREIVMEFELSQPLIRSGAIYIILELEGHWRRMKKQERDAQFYVDRMTPFIRTPLQRLRNVGVINNRAIRDLLNGRTSHETVVEVIRKAKEFDDLAEKRGVAEPLSALASGSSQVGRGRKSKPS
jgi:hypothetical protein